VTSDQLDRVDFSIILTLREDSRTSLKELASRAGVSIPTAKSRLHRLIDAGIIKLIVHVDPSKTQRRIAAFVNVETETPEVRRVVDTLTKMTEVDQVFLTTGEYNIALKIILRDTDAFNELLTRKLPQIPGVRLTKGSLILEEVKNQLGFALQPGVDVKLNCSKCENEITGREVKRLINGRDNFFCSEACATIYEEDVTSKEDEQGESFLAERSKEQLSIHSEQSSSAQEAVDTSSL